MPSAALFEQPVTSGPGKGPDSLRLHSIFMDGPGLSHMAAPAEGIKRD